MSYKRKWYKGRKKKRGLGFWGLLLIWGLLGWGCYWVYTSVAVHSGTIIIALKYIGMVIGSGGAIYGFYRLYKWLIERLKTRKLAGKLSIHIQGALAIMDSVGGNYHSEEDANKELVGHLKAKGLRVTRLPRLPNGRYADAKVGNDALIEAKLDLVSKDETDRLIGQLQSYSQYPYKVYVVIYGVLDSGCHRRLREEILARYPEKVFMNWLKAPRRKGTVTPARNRIPAYRH